MGVDIQIFRARIGVWNGAKSICRRKAVGLDKWQQSCLNAFNLIIILSSLYLFACVFLWVVTVTHPVTIFLSESIDNNDARKVFSCLQQGLIIGGVEQNPGPFDKAEDYATPSTSNAGLTNTDDKVSLTPQAIIEISKTINQQDYRSLARGLGINDQDIQKIEIEQRLYFLPYLEIPYQIIKKWHQREGHKATMEFLQEVLRNIKRKDFHPLSTLDKNIEEIRTKQINYYKDMQLPKWLWLKRKNWMLENLFVEVEMKKKDRQGREWESSASIKLNNIFQRENNETNPRILIEGQEGFGKTTLLLKILSDWSKEETYVSELYRLVFFIPLKQFKSSLEYHFDKQCLIKFNSKAEATQIIRNIEGQVLLLLDGWEEATEDTQTKLVPLLKGEIYPNMTVIVTCRSGLHYWPRQSAIKDNDPDTLAFVGSVDYDENKVWEKWITVTGTSRQKEFLQKYLEIDCVDELERKIDEFPIQLNDIYRCPLYLLVLGVIIEANKSECVETKTQLYKTFFHYIINRSLSKEKMIGVTMEIEIFVKNDIRRPVYSEALVSFGGSCLKKMKSKTHSFMLKELIVNDINIYDLGFLSKIVLFREHDEIPHYELFHSSFLEFWAAFYLSTKEETDLANEICNLLRSKIGPTEDQLVFQFLAGLLGSEVTKLFKSLWPYKDLIGLLEKNESGETYSLQPLLAEVLTPPTQISASLKHFVPIYLSETNCTAPDRFLKKWIEPILNQPDVVRELKLNTDFVYKGIDWIPKGCRVKKLILIIDEMKTLSIMKGRFTCEELTIQNQCRSLLKSPQSLSELLQNIRLSKVSLEFHAPCSREEMEMFSEEIGCLKNVNVHSLSIIGIEVNSFDLIGPSIAELITSEKPIIQLKLTFKYSKNNTADTFMFNDFFNAIVNSQILCFAFDVSEIHDSIRFPSSFFIRKWNYLEFRGNFKIEQKNKDKIEVTCVEHFNCIDFNSEDKILLPHLIMQCENIKKLACSRLEELKTLTDWAGWNTIEELELNNQIISEQSRSLISRFKNLKELKISVLYHSNKQDEQFVVNYLLHMVSSLTTLILDCEDKYIVLEFLKKLSTLTKDEKEERRLHLKTLIAGQVQVEPFPMTELIGEYWELILSKTATVETKTRKLPRKADEPEQSSPPVKRSKQSTSDAATVETKNRNLSRQTDEPEQSSPPVKRSKQSTLDGRENLQKGKAGVIYSLTELWELSKQITPSECRSLARELRLTEQEIEHIEKDQGRGGLGPSEIPYQILKAWCQREGSRATIDVIANALIKIRTIGIQDRQREYFKDLQLPRFLWMEKKFLPLEKLYVELTLTKKDKNGRQIMENIALENVFQMEEEKENRRPRIFIEGQPGFGKTTLLWKILSDWARKQNYVCSLFNLVFFIPLRGFKGDLETHCLQQCHGIITTKAEVSQTIGSIKGKVLLLLDGWDEASDSTKMALMPLLKGLVYNNVTVVITSRTGFHHLPEKKDDILSIIGSGGYEQYEMWDQRIQVKGISREKRNEFLRKYLEIDPNDLARTLDKLPVIFDDFYRCPLFLLLLGTLIKHKKFLEKTLNTKTQLYKTIFNFVVKRSLVKEEKLWKDVDMDLFDPHNSQSSLYRDVVIAFGRLCLQKLKAQLLSFQEKEIVVNSFDISLLGFLTKNVLSDEDEEKPAFELIHKSFLEFLAAFYLSTIPETELATEVKELFQATITPTRDQLVYPFLCGLLDADAAKLFRSLLPFNDIIPLLDVKNDYVNKLEPLLNEIANANEEMYKSLTQFVPKFLIHDDDDDDDDGIENNYPCVEYGERWVGPVVKLSNKIQVMKKFKFNDECLETIRFLNCLKCFRIKTMKIFTWEITKLAEINREFKCQNLFFYHSLNNGKESLARILERLSQFCFWDRLHLVIDIEDNYDEFVQICEDLTNGESMNVNVYHLSIMMIEIGKFHSISSSFADLLKAKKVTFGIQLHFRNESEFDEFLLGGILNIIVSSHILSLSLSFSSFYHPIVFPSAIFKTQRIWKYLKLKGHFINPKSDEDIVCTPISNLNCISFKPKTLLPYLFSKCDEIKKLRCNEIEEIQGDILNGWKGFFTIESLELKEQYINDDTFHSLIYRFQNLRKLKINQLIIRNDKVVDALMKTISSLPHLNTLSIQCEEDSLVLYHFLERLSCLPEEEKRKIPLKKLVLNRRRVNPFPMQEIIQHYKWITRTKGERTLLELRDIQREQYKRDDRIPSLMWLEGGVLIDSLFVHLESQNFMTDGEVSQLKYINMKELFDSQTSRILVEGSSPEENKIFCCKVLRKWAKHSYYFHFSLLFHIETKDFVNCASIEDVLIEKFPGQELISKNVIMNCINAYQHRILLILEDNNDERSEETERILEPLLSRRLFNKMKIMVTSINGISLLNKYSTQIFKETSENDKEINTCFNRRVLIKHFDVRHSHKLPQEKWLKMRESIMNSIDSKRVTNILNSSPFFFPSLCLMITEERSTRNYKNYFNFIVKLLNSEEQVDLFRLHSLSDTFSHEQTLIRFGEYALQKMINNESVTMDDNDIILNLGVQNIFRFVFLVKPSEFYEPIDESLTVFLAAFSTFNVMRVSGEEDFKRKIKTLVFKDGLLPIGDNNILFFSFLGGLLNERATLLFEELLPLSGWFNLHNKSSTHILQEITDIHPFVDTFRHLLTSFTPSLYDSCTFDDEYLSSSIHLLLFNEASKSNVIDTLLIYNFKLSFLKKNVTIKHLVMNINDFDENVETHGANLLKCETLTICFGVIYINIRMWSALCSALDMIQKEKCIFHFKSDYRNMNSFLLNGLHKELTEGQWKETTIHRLQLTITEDDDPECLHKLVHLVRNHKIKEAVYVTIKESYRKEELKTKMNSDLQELFDLILQSGSVSEFLISNADSSLSPVFDFSRLQGEQESSLRSVYLAGSVIALNGDKRSESAVEEALILCEGDRCCIQSFRGIKWLWCRKKCFDCLVEDEWQQLNELEELTLSIEEEESIRVNPFISDLLQLRILTLTFDSWQIPKAFDLFLHELLSSLSLRILQLFHIPDFISNFDCLVGCLVKGLNGKRENSNVTPLLEELVLQFDQIEREVNWYALKESKGVKEIEYLLQENLMRQFSWVDDYRSKIPSDLLCSLFSLGHRFTIKQEVHGSSLLHSRHSQWQYRWRKPVIKYCITYSNRD